MSTDESAWFLPAHAKINLGLRVLSRRPDGYHEIDSWMHTVGLHDDLWVRAESTEAGQDPVVVEISRDAELGGLDVVGGPDNLVVRAARSFLDRTALGSRIRLRYALHKRIPAGGGLGGGSADAAAALRLANVACGEPLTMQDLHGLAAELGADVPFFLAGGTQRARGIGDRLEPLRGEAPFLHVVLVMPRTGTSTVEVYRALKLPSGKPGEDRGLGDRPRVGIGRRFGNDLEETAFALDSELARLRDRARELGADTIELSGSGSTMFVPCPSLDAMRLTRQALAPLTAEFGAHVVATTSASLYGPPRFTRWLVEPRSVQGERRDAASGDASEEGAS